MDYQSFWIWLNSEKRFSDTKNWALPEKPTEKLEGFKENRAMVKRTMLHQSDLLCDAQQICKNGDD